MQLLAFAILLKAQVWDMAVPLCVQACKQHGVKPGVFCLGQSRAQTLAAQGYEYVAYEVDLNMVINYSRSTVQALKDSA
jgi:2-keto-3-deoxy-L-rhamnonate aldolase RhmA